MDADPRRLDKASLEIQFALEAIAAGNWRDARARCEALLAREPDSGEVQHTLGLICWGEEDPEAAVCHLERAIAALAAEATWHSDLGVLYALLGRWREAAGCFTRCLEITPDDADALLNCARALAEEGEHGQARDLLERALAIDPDRAASWTELGRVLLACNRLDEAERALLHSLTLSNSLARTHEFLAELYQRAGRLEPAVTHAHELVRLRLDADSCARLALTCWHDGDIKSCMEAWDAAFFRGISDPRTHSTLLYLRLFDPEQSGKQLYRAHEHWARTHVPRIRARPAYANSADPDRPLKIGYLTADLLPTPTYYFLAPLLRNHDRVRFTTYLYDLHRSEAQDGPEYKELACVQRDVCEMVDDEIAKAIRDDEIDILVDLLGHHGCNRLTVFARRPAPVQAAFPNYPCTTGLAEIEYLLTDVWTTPEGTETEYAERIYRLPAGCLVYAPPDCAPPVLPPPAVEAGHVTFGVFQRPAKLNSRLWDAIAAVLERVPGSRLLLHHACPDYDVEGSRIRRRICGELGDRGISAERVRFRGACALPQHLDVLAEADIALDSFPYNGQTTTCECLWMGVPVVTLSGTSHAARVGSGILHQAGMETYVAESATQYVETAVTLAAGVQRLAEIRAGLRERVAASPLADAAARTRQIEAAYRGFWEHWCNGRTLSAG